MQFISLKEAMGISPEERSKLGDYNDKLKDVAEFLNDALEQAEDLPFIEALKNAAPWAIEIADSSGIPFLKFATTFLSKLLKQKDPEVLGRLACTLSYQRSVQDAATALHIGPPEKNSDFKLLKAEMKSYSPTSNVDFKNITLSNVLSHEFINDADRALLFYAEHAGYSVSQRTKLQSLTHRRFITNLRLILTNRETAEKFEPFRLLISMAPSEQSPYATLEEHEAYQRRLFEELPVFTTEPFALKDIYVDSDCSELKWSEIQSRQVDPFGPGLPRKPLLDRVMELIGSKNFDDAIVIQAVAGAGKSSFTLKLCRVLSAQGFQPIRIRLRDVPLNMNMHIREALSKAVLLHDPFTPLTERGHASQDDVFAGGNLFRERIFHNGFQICPYVLILDGWDEISLSAPEGYRVQVSKMLRELRDEYLRNRDPKVRVVITGRPSIDVNESHFLLQNTPVLTVRALTPDRLDLLIEKLVKGIESKPLGGQFPRNTDFANKAEIPKILEEYRKCFIGEENISGSMEIFSLPLLAHLAIRLVAVTPPPVDDLLKSPTNLYRNLVDEIIWRRSRLGEGSQEIVEQTGPDLVLRKKLQQTAAAITVFGKESIPFRELALRLGMEPKELRSWAEDSSRNHFLTDLLINFFFKGSNEKLGCEFLHKSFREYLFAEYVVEMVKRFGREQSDPWRERLASEYWVDFKEKSPLWTLSRGLSECLSAQWLTKDSFQHIRALIEWEIARAEINMELEDKIDVYLIDRAMPTEPLNIRGWEAARDALVDLWDWWGEGVHLRRPVSEDERGPIFLGAYADDLVKNAAPRDRDAQHGGMPTVRFTTLDAHLGDALFRLNMLVHFQVAQKTGWLNRSDYETPGEAAAELWREASGPGAGPRRYQTIVTQGKSKWVLFAPSGQNSDFFENYCSRINAAGWRSPFPASIFLQGVDLRETAIRCSYLPFNCYACNLSNVDLTAGVINAELTLGAALQLSNPHHYLCSLSLNRCYLEGAVLGGAFNRELPSKVENCNLRNASFDFADLWGSKFINSPTKGATFRESMIGDVEFDAVSRADEEDPNKHQD